MHHYHYAASEDTVKSFSKLLKKQRKNRLCVISKVDALQNSRNFVITLVPSSAMHEHAASLTAWLAAWLWEM
jgi:hypothetical protein